MYKISFALPLGALLKKVARKGEEYLPKSLTGPLRRGYKRLKDKGSKFIDSLGSIFPNASKYGKDIVTTAVNRKVRMHVENIVNDTFGEQIENATEKVKEIWMHNQTYIGSHDPVSAIHVQLHFDIHLVNHNMIDLHHMMRY